MPTTRPLRSRDLAERLLGLDDAGEILHDGWSLYAQFNNAGHQPFLTHLLHRCKELLETATRGPVRFPRQAN